MKSVSIMRTVIMAIGLVALSGCGFLTNDSSLPVEQGDLQDQQQVKTIEEASKLASATLVEAVLTETMSLAGYDATVAKAVGGDHPLQPLDGQSMSGPHMSVEWGSNDAGDAVAQISGSFDGEALGEASLSGAFSAQLTVTTGFAMTLTLVSDEGIQSIIPDAASANKSGEVDCPVVIAGIDATAIMSVVESGSEVTIVTLSFQGSDCTGEYACTETSEQQYSCEIVTCQAEDEICDDGVDNDCDTLVDCADEDCALDPICIDCAEECAAYGGGCSRELINVCSAETDNKICRPVEINGVTCHCLMDPPAQLSEKLNCRDGYDNDCDGKTDCLDEDCNPRLACEGTQCNKPGYCDGERCVEDVTCAPLACEQGEPADEVCFTPVGFEPLDEDCDGFIDCSDPDCKDNPVCKGSGGAVFGGLGIGFTCADDSRMQDCDYSDIEEIPVTPLEGSVCSEFREAALCIPACGEETWPCGSGSLTNVTCTDAVAAVGVPDTWGGYQDIACASYGRLTGDVWECDEAADLCVPSEGVISCSHAAWMAGGCAEYGLLYMGNPTVHCSNPNFGPGDTGGVCVDNGPEICADGFDNDGDAAVDCWDDDCALSPACQCGDASPACASDADCGVGRQCNEAAGCCVDVRLGGSDLYSCLAVGGDCTRIDPQMVCSDSRYDGTSIVAGFCRIREICDDAGFVDEDGDGDANCFDTDCISSSPTCETELTDINPELYLNNPERPRYYSVLSCRLGDTTDGDPYNDAGQTILFGMPCDSIIDGIQYERCVYSEKVGQEDFGFCVPQENCETPGDENFNGLEDCEDPYCKKRNARLCCGVFPKVGPRDLYVKGNMNGWTSYPGYQFHVVDEEADISHVEFIVPNGYNSNFKIANDAWSKIYSADPPTFNSITAPPIDVFLGDWDLYLNAPNPSCVAITIDMNLPPDEGEKVGSITDFNIYPGQGYALEDCSNGFDDDGDGNIDCADLDCAGPACVEDCTKPGDEDGDGFADCDDPDDCAGKAICTTGEVCDNFDENGPIDDDGDGLANCYDPECKADIMYAPMCCGFGLSRIYGFPGEVLADPVYYEGFIDPGAIVTPYSFRGEMNGWNTLPGPDYELYHYGTGSAYNGTEGIYHPMASAVAEFFIDPAVDGNGPPMEYKIVHSDWWLNQFGVYPLSPDSIGDITPAGDPAYFGNYTMEVPIPGCYHFDINRDAGWMGMKKY